MDYKSSKPALFFVEGEHEKDFLVELTNRNLCRENRTVNFGLNGKNVSIEAMVNKICALVIQHTRRIQHHPIVVLFDREGRSESFAELAKEFRSRIRALDHNEENFIIGVADKKIESWMLPFVDPEGNFSTEPSKISDQVDSEKELAKRLKKRKIIYKKRTIGVELLLKIDPQKLALVSESFAPFYDEIKKHCKWMNRRN